MSLQEKLDKDLKEAMISKDAPKLSTIRLLKSALKYTAIEKKTDSLTDAEIQQVIQKQIKQRRESIEQFTRGGRAELAGKEEAEVRVLESYLPKQMPDVELQKFVEAEAKAAGAVSKKDFGRMMKLLSEKLAGQADAKRVSEFLGKILQ
jgi:hypothetical protein